MDQKKYLIFECLLDITANIVGTTVVHSLKHAHPDREIIVVTSFPEVWLHNPDVYRVYKIGAFQFFFDDYIRDRDTLVCKHNPVLTTEYAQGTKPLAEIWCDLYSIPLITRTPRLFFTWREKEAVQKLTKSDKPIVFIESESIAFGFGRLGTQPIATGWQGRIPPLFLQETISTLQNLGYIPVDISNNPNVPGIEIEKLNLALRLKLCAIQYCEAVITLNSFTSHMAKMFNKKAVVLWLSDSVDTWGYADQYNAVPHADSDTVNFLQTQKKEFSLQAQKNCPYNLNVIFDSKKICEYIKNNHTNSL